MMTKNTFIEVPAYADNPAEYERTLQHNASILTKPQLIKMVVMLAIESEQNRMGIQEAGIDAHEDALTIKYLDKFKGGLRQKGQHLKGGNTMAKRAEDHEKNLTDAVLQILKNPATSDWSNPKIARWLIQKGFHKSDGKKPIELSEQTMTDRVRAIRDKYKAGNLTS